MTKPPLVALYGYSESGKTSLLVDLIEKFTAKEVNVCTIKHKPAEVSVDEEGKDTWRHVNAGSNLTVFSTQVETDFFLPNKCDLEEIVDLIARVGKCDLVLAEGFKSSSAPKVAVGDIETKENTLIRYKENLPRVVEEIEREMRITSIENELPGLDCGLCGNDTCREMAEGIERGKRNLEDCRILKDQELDLKVDGEKIPLENFPANMIKYSLKGMLGTLKGVNEDIEHISLEADL